ncbi:MAG: SPFH domain-containing protein [bacterium JZ-2024 1]
MTTLTYVAALLIFFLFWILSQAIKVLPEWERGVILRLGRLTGVKGPGIVFIIPIVDRLIRVDLRTFTMDVPAQEIITRDNVTVKVDAVVYFRVMEPEKAVTRIQNHIFATSMIAQTTLRSTVGQVELDELLAHREKINQALQEIIDKQTDPWGVKVSIVELKNVELPDTMKRVMARQAEAERERRAKIINAEGEYLASERLAEAARVLAQNPISVQLRFLQTLTEVSAEKATVLFVPFPLDIFQRIMPSLQTVPSSSSSSSQ